MEDEGCSRDTRDPEGPRHSTLRNSRYPGGEVRRVLKLRRLTGVEGLREESRLRPRSFTKEEGFSGGRRT